MTGGVKVSTATHAGARKTLGTTQACLVHHNWMCHPSGVNRTDIRGRAVDIVLQT